MHRTTHGAVKRHNVFLFILRENGERRTEWRMEADRLERGLAGREVRFLPDSYLLDPLFPCSCNLKVHSPLALITNSGLHRLNYKSRKQTTGRTRAGVDAREGTGAEATGIGQRVGRLGNSLEKGG
uniref:Uncharacterized protein n=1 Tax=Ammopiptanthus mongolicus TaxID=126911 RepID=A0A4P8PFS9_AMMMO|nr:hypothetical protein [Ammopiptanthus mongolicus]